MTSLEEFWREFVTRYRREIIRRDIRNLAITLALELSAYEAADLLESCGFKVFDTDLKEPWWLEKAREFYYSARAEKPPKLPLISKARNIVKRYGVPEIYYRLAEAIVLNRCNLPA